MKSRKILCRLLVLGLVFAGAAQTAGCNMPGNNSSAQAVEDTADDKKEDTDKDESKKQEENKKEDKKEDKKEENQKEDKEEENKKEEDKEDKEEDEKTGSADKAILKCDKDEIIENSDIWAVKEEEIDEAVEKYTNTLTNDHTNPVYMMINEIYARHGAVFSYPDIQEYFDKKTWYKDKGKSIEDCQTELKDVEKKNLKIFQYYLKNHDMIIESAEQ